MCTKPSSVNLKFTKSIDEMQELRTADILKVLPTRIENFFINKFLLLQSFGSCFAI